MVDFHLPPFLGFVFLVEVHHTVAVKRCVARHQIQKALTAVFVCKDLFPQK